MPDTATTRRSSYDRAGRSGPEDHAIWASSCRRRSSPRPARSPASSTAPRALADAGVGALVLPSLFEEEIVAEEVGLSFALEAGSEHFAEALDYFPAVTKFTSSGRPVPRAARADQEGGRRYP